MYLLDAHVLVWMALSSKRLPLGVKALLISENLSVSAVSEWEIYQKSHMGKLPLPLPAHVFVRNVCHAYNIERIDFTSEDCGQVLHLPPIHKDPFDRMLISQARNRGLTLISADSNIARYPISVYWQ